MHRQLNVRRPVVAERAQHRPARDTDDPLTVRALLHLLQQRRAGLSHRDGCSSPEMTTRGRAGRCASRINGRRCRRPDKDCRRALSATLASGTDALGRTRTRARARRQRLAQRRAPLAGTRTLTNGALERAVFATGYCWAGFEAGARPSWVQCLKGYDSEQTSERTPQRLPDIVKRTNNRRPERRGRPIRPSPG